MFVAKLALAALLSTTGCTAFPASLSGRQSSQTCVDTCGTVCYWNSDISAAVDKGYSLLQSGSTLGSDEYPHTYRDDEGFSFPVDGPYYEFPILSTYKVYSGGSPGADRVVFDDSGELAGLITHTGSAVYDGFVQCTAD